MKELLLFLTIIFIIILILLMWHVQNNVLFKPEEDHVWKPDIEYEDLFIGSIHAWYFNLYENRPVILYCHGNNANISYREYVCVMAQGFKCNLLLFDYRGYGKSKEKPSQKKIRQDGENAYNWLTQRHKPSDIIIMGESLGGAVAIHLASKYICRCVILFSTFSSISEAITESDYYPWWMKGLAIIASWFLDILPSKYTISGITEPITIVHSIEDNTIPISNAYELYKNVMHYNKTFIEIKGSHINPIINIEQFRDLYYFCNSGDIENNCNHRIIDEDFENTCENTLKLMDECSKKFQKMCE